MYGIALLLHVLGATIWTGGHIVLATCILPKALKLKSPETILSFEQAFEKVGIPALIIQVVTGVYLAFSRNPAFWDSQIMLKLTLLGCTFLLAIDARLRIIPKLSQRNLVSLAWHIIPVTILSILFVVVGVSYRTAWFI